MNFSFYILGTLQEKYSQYPDDYTVSILADLQKGMANARLVIYREMDLMHYIYAERLNGTNIIGFCLIFNKAHLLKPSQLIKFFRLIVEKRMAEVGSILEYSKDGELLFKVNSLNESSKEYDILKEYINSELESNPSRLDIEPLTTIYNGMKSVGEIDGSASDTQILELVKLHNKVIVNEIYDIERSGISQIITDLRTQNQKANEEIKFLQDKNSDLNRQKKQYRYVIFLVLGIIGCGIGLLFLNDNLNLAEIKLADANKTISINNDSLQSKSRQVAHLTENVKLIQNKLSREVSRCESIEEEFSAFKRMLNAIQPIIIKTTSFNFSSGLLSFDYYGLRSEVITLQARVYSPKESYIKSTTIYVKEGFYSGSIYIGRDLNNETWYSFELLLGNKIIGGGRH